LSAKKRAVFYALYNESKQMQRNGHNIADIWVIFATGFSAEQALDAALARQPLSRKEDYIIVEDTPESQAKYGNPRPV
jgi:hypothetical protein